jgi:citrate lyase subunit beta/citryl-CoA lyase
MARCYLYVPGHRPDRFDKALVSGADAVILDLEDAVPVVDKDDALRNVRSYLARLMPGPVEAWVRINDGDRGRDDLGALAGTGALAGVVVPKGTPEVLAVRHADAPDVALIALVESAIAVTQAVAIAASPGVQTLAIGEVDLAADLGLGDEVPDAAVWAVRMQVVLACATTGQGAPLGPVARDIEDLTGFATTVRQLHHAGFGAVQTIHPKQVSVVIDEFTPTADELAAARQLLAAAARADGGVFTDDTGRMIDEAVLRSARRTLERVSSRAADHARGQPSPPSPRREG